MSTLELMPWPQRLEHGDGASAGAASGAVQWAGVRTARLERAVAAWRTQTEPHSGTLPLVLACETPAPALPGPDMNEAYRLTVTAAAIQLSAPTEWGVLRGLATLAQLGAGPLPVLELDDAPRFPWRGLMLDVARHFLSPAALTRTLRLMAHFKLNVLHLHLSDDQGFRFPSRAFPRLASEPSYPPEALRQLVTDAAALGIRVVPELDMPGHVTSWLAAYPEWGALPEAPPSPSTRFGVHPACLDPASERVYAAVERLVEELADYFPDPCVHIGGDEVHPDWWLRSEAVQTLQRDQQLADTAAVQAVFMARVARLLEQQGKRPLVWDEAINARLPADALVQTWRGATARDRARHQGFDCVVSDGYYLDLFYPADLHYRRDPEASQADAVLLEDALLEDPRLAHVADGLRWTEHWREPASEAGTAAGRVLGAEACLWSELVTEPLLDGRLWTRLPVLAERFWSAATVRDEEACYRRLLPRVAALKTLGLTDLEARQRTLLQAAGLPAAACWLADWLEPVKWYARLLGEEALAARLAGTEMPESRPYQTSTPLNRVVDALFPESLATRALQLALAAGDTGPLRRAAERWQLAAAQPDLPSDVVPLAERLTRLSEWVIARLNGAPLPADLYQRVTELAEPRGELLLAPALALRDWLCAHDDA